MARILVVDDDASARLAMKAILETHGHSIVLVESGHRAVDAIEAYAFEVAIIDIFMPGMSGLETIKIFRRNAPTLPILVISGYARRNIGDPAQDFFRTALDLGAVCCLAKPFKSAELLQAVESCRAATAHKVA
jgi:two-component system chemotaxis response regulator CheY